jgi:hypothetical protein
MKKGAANQGHKQASVENNAIKLTNSFKFHLTIHFLAALAMQFGHAVLSVVG